MLKILQAGFNSIWTMYFQMFKLVLEKAEEPEIQLSTSVGSWKKQESSRITSTSALLTTPKPVNVDHIKVCKILKDMGILDWSAFWEIYMQVKKQQLELDMEQ